METRNRNKRKRTRVNRYLMAWSDGKRVNIIPSVFRQVDDYGRLMRDYHRSIDKGYLRNVGPCTMAREECQIREYEADRDWERGHHLEALKEMLRAALFVLPDEEPACEDNQLLDPWQWFCSHPNVREFLRLIRRCRDYCRQDPRLWPVLESDDTYRDYRQYLTDLSHWSHGT